MEPTIKPKYGQGSWYAITDADNKFVRWELLLYHENKRYKGTSRLEDELDAYAEARARAEANKARALGASPKKPKVKRAKGKPTPQWTIREYAEHWLKHIEYLSKDRQHYHRQRIQDHILPYIGDIAIGELSAADCEHLFKTVLVQKGLGDYGRSEARKALTQMLTHAREREHPPLLFHKPVSPAMAPVPKGRKEDTQDSGIIWKRAEAAHKMLYEARTADEAWKQGKKQIDPFLNLWLNLTFFGIRKGEMSGLTWDNIDLGENKSIKINGQIVYRREWRGSRYTTDLKTKDSRRQFGITNQLAAALILWKQTQDHLKKQPDWKPQDRDYVLTHKDGRAFIGNDQNEYWTNYKQDFFTRHPDLKTACDPENWVQHYNRHITASMFKDWGIPYEDTKRILGHGDKAITEKIYTQTRPESLNATIAAISENFEAASEQFKLEEMGEKIAHAYAEE